MKLDIFPSTRPLTLGDSNWFFSKNSDLFDKCLPLLKSFWQFLLNKMAFFISKILQNYMFYHIRSEKKMFSISDCVAYYSWYAEKEFHVDFHYRFYNFWKSIHIWIQKSSLKSHNFMIYKLQQYCKMIYLWIYPLRLKED